MEDTRSMIKSGAKVIRADGLLMVNVRYTIKLGAKVIRADGQVFEWPDSCSSVDKLFYGSVRGTTVYLSTEDEGSMAVAATDVVTVIVPKQLDNSSIRKLHGLIQDYPRLNDMLEGGLDLVDCIDLLVKEIDKLEQNSCEDCDNGWKYNRVEGRHACTCMTEAEPFQILETALCRIADLGRADGMTCEEIAKEALFEVSPLDQEDECQEKP